MRTGILLCAKADVVIGALLVARNRAVRWVCGLTVVAAAILAVQAGDRHPAVNQPLAAFSIVGTLAALAGARLFAPGGAFASARQVARTWWAVPLGRLAGALLVIMPVAAAPVLALGLSEADPMRAGLAATTLAAAVASFSFSLAPIVGSSAAITLTLAAVWVGAVPYTTMRGFVENWPLVRSALDLLWRILPLPWRANRLIEAPAAADAGVLVAWVLVGMLAIGAATETSLRTRLACGSRTRQC